jgi:membrane associated rhomboid family serine protease
MSPSTLQIALPEFRGLTRWLVLCNMATFFVLLILSVSHIVDIGYVLAHFGFTPSRFLAGEIWQPLTASFVQTNLLGTAFALLMLWFLGSLLEDWHGSSWFGWLFAFSILGSMLTATAIYVGMRLLAPTHEAPDALLASIGDGLFGLLVAIGVLHGDVEFRLFFIVLVKARYLAIIAALIALAKAFGDAPVYAIAQLGAGLAAYIYLRMAPRRGFGFAIAFNLSERWYGMRNGYYRWKRRRAASKFQVYMKKQGRTVRFDGQGRSLDDDDDRGHDDKKRWN